MTIRASLHRQWTFTADASAVVTRLESEYGERFRREALQTWHWADEQMVGEAWNEVLFTVSAWVARGVFRRLECSEAGWLWVMLRRHLRWLRQYQRLRRHTAAEVGRDESWWARRVSWELAEDARQEQVEKLLQLLTPRQREVAAMLAAGTPRHEVARLLGVDRSSVRDCVACIRTKLLAAQLQREAA
jgi:hypothetical protein